MKFFALLATLTSGAIAHGGIDLMHEHNGGVFRGVPRPIGCNAPNLTAGEPEGTLVNLTSSIEAYVVTPKQRRKPNSAIIYLSDIFGLPLLNNRLLADNIADAGFQVVFPDLFDGDAVPVNAMGSSSFNMTAWRERHPVSAIDEIITATIRAVSEDYGFEGIGAVGYCFGGKYVARFLAEGKGLDAGFTAHPSGLTAEELSRVAYPISIAYAGESSLRSIGAKTRILTWYSER